MSVSELYTAGLGTILGVQATPQENIGSLVVLDVHINQSNIAPERSGIVLLSIDGILYRVAFRFAEETLDQRTQEGYAKKRNPSARLR